MRLTRKVFTDLAIRMIGFGILIGLLFPFFTMLFGVSDDIALSGWFLSSCIFAGFFVGTMNIFLARITVGKRLKLIAGKMTFVKQKVLAIAEGGNINTCTPENCFIPVDSDDEFGECARAFNELIESFSKTLQIQDGFQTYSQILTSQLELDILGRNALDLMIPFASASGGAILIENEGELKLVTSTGIRSPELLTSHPIILDTLRKGKKYLVKLPEQVVIESLLTEYRPSEVLAEPIKYKDVPLGIIILASTNDFSQEFINRIETFSHVLALALHNALEHEQLQKLAALDPLTGIYNRRFGLSRLRDEYTRSIRTGNALGVMMMDIDHFKQVNDTYGHIAGDRVIKNVAHLARQVLREGDILIRYGGEEFLLLLPGASREDVGKVAERLRYIIKSSSIPYGESQILVTISVGCDSYPESEIKTEMDLIANADEALYRAKEAGRDRIILH